MYSLVRYSLSRDRHFHWMMHMVTHMLFVMEFPQISHGATYQQKRPSEISNFNQIGIAFGHKYSYTSDFFLFLYKRLQRRNRVASDLPRRDISVMKINLVRFLILIRLELLLSINTHTLDFPNVYTKDRKAVYRLFLCLCFAQTYIWKLEHTVENLSRITGIQNIEYNSHGDIFFYTAILISYFKNKLYVTFIFCYSFSLYYIS